MTNLQVIKMKTSQDITMIKDAKLVVVKATLKVVVETFKIDQEVIVEIVEAELDVISMTILILTMTKTEIEITVQKIVVTGAEADNVEAMVLVSIFFAEDLEEVREMAL